MSDPGTSPNDQQRAASRFHVIFSTGSATNSVTEGRGDRLKAEDGAGPLAPLDAPDERPVQPAQVGQLRLGEVPGGPPLADPECGLPQDGSAPQSPKGDSASRT